MAHPASPWSQVFLLAASQWPCWLILATPWTQASLLSPGPGHFSWLTLGLKFLCSPLALHGGPHGSSYGSPRAHLGPMLAHPDSSWLMTASHGFPCPPGSWLPLAHGFPCSPWEGGGPGPGGQGSQQEPGSGRRAGSGGRASLGQGGGQGQGRQGGSRVRGGFKGYITGESGGVKGSFAGANHN